MYFTYPILVFQLQNLINDFVDERSGSSHSDYQLTADERLYYYQLYNSTFGFISRINPEFSKIIELFTSCLHNEEVLLLLPMKNISHHHLLFDGVPTGFVLIIPFDTNYNVINNKIIWDQSMNLIYELLFIVSVLKYNTDLKYQGLNYLNLNNPMVLLELQKERLDQFREFWYLYSAMPTEYPLPDNLLNLIRL
jgi:hypothetical protein